VSVERCCKGEGGVGKEYEGMHDNGISRETQRRILSRSLVRGSRLYGSSSSNCDPGHRVHF
jgi:hypothetical protein